MKIQSNYDEAKKRLNERAERILKVNGYTREVKKVRLLFELIKEQTPK